jgi:hypothetical protein
MRGDEKGDRYFLNYILMALRAVLLMRKGEQTAYNF